MLQKMHGISKGELQVLNIVKISPPAKKQKSVNLPIDGMGFSTIKEEDQQSKVNSVS